MPLNRNALLRYRIIDDCLKNRGRKWTWKDIVNKVNEGLLEDNPDAHGIGKTTFYEDLKNIEYRIYSMEIERVKEGNGGKRVFLRYKDLTSSIFNQPIGEAEAKVLKDAIFALSRFKGLPQFEWLQELLPIIDSKIKFSKGRKEIVAFDSNLDYKGIEYLPQLINAIENKKVVSVEYQNFSNPSLVNKELHPYHIKQYNNRWYIFGRDQSDYKIINLALDRIKQIAEIDSSYIEDENNWDDYFDDFIGVTKLSKDIETVKLLILNKKQAGYIETKPLHQTQKALKEVDGGYETQIEVIPNIELEKLILSFGENIKVLSPKSLVKTISDRIMNLQGIYEPES